MDAGQPLRKWQVDAFALLTKDFYHNVHLHHEHEEVIFFPWMETRVKLPPKMSSDHKTLMAALDRVRELCCSQMKAGMEQEAAKVGPVTSSNTPPHHSHVPASGAIHCCTSVQLE